MKPRSLINESSFLNIVRCKRSVNIENTEQLNCFEIESIVTIYAKHMQDKMNNARYVRTCWKMHLTWWCWSENAEQKNLQQQDRSYLPHGQFSLAAYTSDKINSLVFSLPRIGTKHVVCDPHPISKNLLTYVSWLSHLI